MEQLKKILYIFSKKQKIHIVLLVGIIVVGSLIEMIGLALLVPFINAMTNPASVNTTWYLSYLYKMLGFSNISMFLAFFAFAIVTIYVLKNVYLGVMYSLIYRFTYNNQRRMAYRLLTCYLKQPYLFFTHYNSSELIRNIEQDTSMFFDTVSASMMLLNEIIVCGLLVIVIFSTDPVMALGVTVFLALCMVTVLRLFKRMLREKGQNVRTSMANINKWLLQTFGGIKETKVAGKEQFFLDNVDKFYNIFSENHRQSQILQYLPKPIMETVSICGVLLLIGIKLTMGADPMSFVAILSVFAVAAMRLLPAFNRISNYISRIMFNHASVNSVYDDLIEIEELENSKTAIDVDEEIPGYNNKLDINNLTFRYPEADKNVLTDVSISIPKNKSVAFIGPSGAGKTTLADIILGVLTPTSGTICIDDFDISKSMNSWHKIIGYIPQTIFLMDDTIRNNILYGTSEEEVDESLLAQAIADAQLTKVIDELEDGLDTVVGERGVRLSGGQRQRIGIARALYNNPQILILDEATSSLDNDTEKAIMEAIDSLAGKKTLIIIAHRLSTISNCDYIFRIENEKVIDITDEFSNEEDN